VVYGNGGRCIQSLSNTGFWVINNTCYKNDLDLTLGNVGSFTSQNSSNGYFINNIAVAWRSNSPAYDQQGSNSNIAYDSDMFLGASNNFSYSDPSQLIQADPLFVNPPVFDPTALGQYATALAPSLLGNGLTLQPTSPALGKGIDPSALSGVPSAIVTDLKKYIYTDINGNTRPQGGGVDLGAYQMSSTPPPPPPPAIPVWVSPGMLRVGPTDNPGTTTFVSLSGARGETVDAQVIVRAPAGGLTNVNLSASTLTGPGGATLVASNLVLYREYYVSVNGTVPGGGGSNPPLGSGTYAEPLVPFNDPQTGSALCGTAATLKACNATVNAGQNQPYWIDISIPRGTGNSPPGIYTGTLAITSTQGNATVPVTLTVWNFELPVQPTEKSIWTLWSPNSGDTVQSLDQALMRNKVMGWYDSSANAAADMTNFG